MKNKPNGITFDSKKAKVPINTARRKL